MVSAVFRATEKKYAFVNLTFPAVRTFNSLRYDSWTTSSVSMEGNWLRR
jgi:hypothetical protein